MQHRSDPIALRVFLAFSVLAVTGACGKKVTRTLVPPARVETLDAGSPFLKAHLRDGSVYVLSAWRVDADSSVVRGTGSLLDANRVTVASGEFRLLADSVALFETNVVTPSGPSQALTVMAVVTGAIAGICLASPKTCFGSCPTFYAPGDEGSMRLQAEGFSSSIAPALEAADVDMLLHTRPQDRDYTIRVTNEALETHVIRYADLLAVRRPAGGRVYMTSSATFREAFGAAPPTRCEAAEGDCLPPLQKADGVERASLADSADLATRETIDLEFADAPGGELGLVLVTRQTLMTTFLIYQALAYLGEDAGRWLARLGADGVDARDRAGGIGRVLGNVEVLVADTAGEWIAAGGVGETGPIATDTRLVTLPRAAGSPLRVRIRLTRGMWRVDYVALVRLGEEVTPERIGPVAVARDGRDDPSALRALTGGDEPLVTLPGDAYEISYRLPEAPSAHELFLESRGYYLEWMRREWMAEENLLLAARMLLDPAGALRELAPAFKREEPRIERLFWSSRYARH